MSLESESCDAFDSKYPDLVKVDFALAKNTVNNLGGVGPESDAAKELYYHNVAQVNADGDKYDLRVTVAGDSYTARDPHSNGENGHYGVVNVKCGTSVDLNFQFVNPTTGEPASLSNLVFSWFDLDSGTLGGGDESVTLWPGYANIVVSSNSEVVKSTVACPKSSGKCTRFSSSTGGNGKDNPKDPMTLTRQQAARTFSVYYEDVSSFKVTLAAAKGFGSRNFLFTGMSQVSYASVEKCCPAHVCGCKSTCQENGAPWEQKCELANCAACDECSETTTTTTTQAPASKEETCKNGLVFELRSESLVENTLGSKTEDAKAGRMLFKNVIEHNGQSLDLSVTDVARDLKYMGRDLTSYEADRRDYTGLIRGAGRIAFDKPGNYMFRFRFTNSETGNSVKLPLFPFALYDVDGKGERVTACNVAGVITHNETTLEERYSAPCYHHIAMYKEVKIPVNFESLTVNQKKQTVTYVYRNTGEWDLQVKLNDREEERYILFKSSKVLACDYEDKTSDEPWKDKGKASDA